MRRERARLKARASRVRRDAEPPRRIDHSTSPTARALRSGSCCACPPEPGSGRRISSSIRSPASGTKPQLYDDSPTMHPACPTALAHHIAGPIRWSGLADPARGTSAGSAHRECRDRSSRPALPRRYPAYRPAAGTCARARGLGGARAPG